MRRFIGLIRDHRTRIGRIVAKRPGERSYGREGEDKDREERESR